MTAPKKRRNPLPAIAQAGPVSVWMVLFVTVPMLFIIYISFMSRGTFGGVEYTTTLTSYETLADVTYFAVILKSLQVAVVTTAVCLLLGYPFAYYIARKSAHVAARLIMLLMIPRKQGPAGAGHRAIPGEIHLHRRAGAAGTDHQLPALRRASHVLLHREAAKGHAGGVG